MSDPAAPAGSCRGCGYALRGLPAGRCPECGRPFDPADPRTVSVGRRPPGRVARLLLAPTGWPTRLAFALGTAAVAYATRPQLGPVGQWDLALVDLRLDPWWLDAGAVRTPTDVAYAAGLWLWAAGLGWLLGRAVVRVVARWWYDAGASASGDDAAGTDGGRVGGRERRWGRAGRPTAATFLAFCGLAVLTAACVLVGWPYRLGRHAAAEYAKAPWPRPSIQVNQFTIPMQPIWSIGGLSAGRESEQRLRILLAAIHQSPDPGQRVTGLAMLADHRPSELCAAAREGVVREQDPSVLEWHVRILGLAADPTLVPVGRRLLGSDEERIRTAVLDAIAAAADDRPELVTLEQVSLASRPPISVRQRDFRHVPPPTSVAEWGKVRPLAFPADVRDRVAERMTGGAALPEREAAARATARLRANASPTDSGSVGGGGRLRLAEWGVRVDADVSGGGTAAVADPDDLPPFVHPFGDPATRFEPQPPGASFAAKSIVHLTADFPTAVRLSVGISAGRTMDAWPKPDDCWFGEAVFWKLHLPPAGRPGRWPQVRFERAKGLRFDDRRNAPPWLLPEALSNGVPRMCAMLQEGLDLADSVGVRWDTLIVAPDRPPWMEPPAVPAGPKHAWWSRLRDVPGSWVSSRGEAERFLYYDGPTMLPPPVRVRAVGRDRLTVEVLDGVPLLEPGEVEAMALARGAGNAAAVRPGDEDGRQQRRGMWVEVRRDGGASAEVVPIPPKGTRSGFASFADPQPATGSTMSGIGAAPPSDTVPEPSARPAVPGPQLARGDVGAGGQPEVRVVPSSDGAAVPRPAYRLGSGRRLAGPAAEAELRAWAVDAGLTGPEADGMMACWREAFFATPGRRFLLLLSAADYDALCPMRVTPTPTESARVGLVWTELPAGTP